MEDNMNSLRNYLSDFYSTLTTRVPYPTGIETLDAILESVVSLIDEIQGYLSTKETLT